MNRKRIFSMLLSLVLTFTVTSSTFAITMPVAQAAVPQITNISTGTSTINSQGEESVKISKEKAKEIAKGIIKTYFNTEIDENKLTQTSNLYTSTYNGEENSSWNINWDMSNMEKTVNISVTLNAETGEITQASNYERLVNGESTVPIINVKDAKQISDGFLKKIQPNKFNESNSRNSDNLLYGASPNYSFNYISKVNGIEYDGNSIGIEVDGVKGKVVSYNNNWTQDLQYPEISGIVDSKTAEEAFKKETKLNLRYITTTQNNYDQNKKDVKLVYIPELVKGNKLDAKDGKILEPYNNVNDSVIRDLNEKEKVEFYNSAKVIIPRESAVEEVEAGKLIKSFISKIYGEGYIVQNLGYQEYAKGNGSLSNKIWSANFNKGEIGKNNEYGNISIDALTGQILNCSKYSNEDNNVSEKFVAKLTWEEAYTKAIQAISQYYPDKVKQIKTEQCHYTYNTDDKIGERGYNFNFIRLENGVEYYDNNINISFSAVTGNMTNLNSNWDKDIKFPEIKSIISKDEAGEIMFNKYKPVLVYTQINKSVNPEKPELETKLAYRLTDDSGLYDYKNIDAFTGKFVNYNGENIDQNIELFKEKIKGSKAEKELSVLAARGLIETSDFKLDQKITQMDLIKMLVNSRGYQPYMAEKAADLKFSNIAKSDANYKYIQMAISYGIMENSEGEFIGDKLVTREDFAKTLVKFTGYSKLAEHVDIFKINYSDVSKISKDNLGYVAIAEAFGYIQVENNEFKPGDIVTMEGLGIGVYNALNNARNTQY